MKFVHAADLHVDSPLRGLDRYEGAPVARLREATRRALENLVALCIEEEAAFLLLAGDVFDGTWKDYSTGLFFASQMTRLREAKVPVVIVRGNHDAASTIVNALRLPDNVHELSDKKAESFALPDANACVHGQSFNKRVTSEDLASKYPARVPGAFNIGLLHTSLDGRPGHASYAPTTIEVLRARTAVYRMVRCCRSPAICSNPIMRVMNGMNQSVALNSATKISGECERYAPTSALYTPFQSSSRIARIWSSGTSRPSRRRSANAESAT